MASTALSTCGCQDLQASPRQFRQCPVAPVCSPRSPNASSQSIRPPPDRPSGPWSDRKELHSVVALWRHRLAGREPPCTGSVWRRLRGAGGCGTSDLNSHRVEGVGNCRDTQCGESERMRDQPVARVVLSRAGSATGAVANGWCERARRRSLFEPGNPMRKAGSPETIRWSGRPMAIHSFGSSLALEASRRCAGPESAYRQGAECAA